MTEDDRRAGVEAELRLAREALSAARMLRGERLHNDALSRLYYALFQTVVALLLTEGVEPKRHRAVAGLLGRHLADVVSADDVALVARTATYRELADYERT